MLIGPRSKGWVDASKAERWLEKLEEGRILKEGWPKYNIQLTKGAMVVRYQSTDPDSIERETQRLEKMGLKRGVHFSVKMPEGGMRVTCVSLGRAWRAPPGSPYAARKSNRGWRLSL